MELAGYRNLTFLCAFLWKGTEQNQWSKWYQIMAHQSSPRILDQSGFIGFMWWPGSSQSRVDQKAYFCNARGVFPITKGNMSPAAPSLVVLGENASAISVTFRVGSLSRMVTAEERPITPAPTTAMEAMLLGNQALVTRESGHATHTQISLCSMWEIWVAELPFFSFTVLRWQCLEWSSKNHGIDGQTARVIFLLISDF